MVELKHNKQKQEISMRLATFVSTFLLAASAFGQSFTTAEIRLAPPAANPVLPMLLPGQNRFEMHGATMLDLIRTAWDVVPQRVVGGPTWLATNKFDFIATGPPGVTREQANDMLKALLADRFKLVVHEDTRPLTGFALTVAKGGPKLKRAASAGAEPGCQRQQESGRTTVACHAVTMSEFADALPGMAQVFFLGRPLVADRTKLDGSWDVTLRFTGGSTEEGAISLTDALEKQAGLHLASANVPMKVIVVDSVNETPTGLAPAVTQASQATHFDVASLKPGSPDGGPVRISLQGGKVDIHNVPLNTLIQVSWNLTPDKIVGLPDFAAADKYDITAVPPAGADSGLDALRAMMQTLLAERFALRMHNEDRTVEVYALTTVKPKLQKADPANRSDCQNAINMNGVVVRTITCRNTTMEQFAAALKRMAGGYFNQNAVVDAAGLDGAYDFAINFSPAGAVQNTASADPNGAISIFDAIDKQLGLKLAIQKRPMPVLVVDHIDRKPTDN
jgi:uncharacterized protein (TIGR03435 family)